MQAFSTAGSLSFSHTACCDAGSWYSPVIVIAMMRHSQIYERMLQTCEYSGVDLTFAIPVPLAHVANVKSKAPLSPILASGPLIQTFARVPSPMGCECLN